MRFPVTVNLADSRNQRVDMTHFDLLKVLGTGGNRLFIYCNERLNGYLVLVNISLCEPRPLHHAFIDRFVFACASLWQSLPGAKEDRHRRWQTLRHESLEEGCHRAEEKNDRAYEDGETSPGGRQGQSLPGDFALRISD